MRLPGLQARRSSAAKWGQVLLIILGFGVLSACNRNKGRQAKSSASGASSVRSPLPDPGATVLSQARTLSLPPAAVDPAAVAGGVLRVHLDADPPHLNPLSDNNALIARVTEGLVFEPLLSCVNGEVRPGLAEAWDVSPDGLRVSLKLRANVSWHDGHHLSVVDVQATFESLLQLASKRPMFRGLLADVEGIEIGPDRVVRLRLVRPSAQVLYALCEIPVLPALAETGNAQEKAQLARQPIGTGPFRFGGWDRGRRIKLLRNASYWGERKALLDQLWFEIDGDGARAMTRTKRSQIDILPQVLPIHFPDQLEPVALGSQLEVYRLTPLRFAFVLINTRRDPLSDARFRWALSRLWQRERLAKELHQGLARPLGGPPLGDRPPTAFDREQAMGALDAAGYKDLNADGVRDRGEAPMRLVFLHVTGSKVVAKEAHQFALGLRRAGILLDIQSVDSATFMSRLKDGNFDLAPLMWEGMPDEDPRSLFGPQGVFSYGGYRSPQLDGLLEEWVLARGVASRREVASRLGALMAGENPALFLYRFDSLALVNRRVRGLAATGDRLDYRFVWLADGRDPPPEAP